jgi:putative LysE/RhtB family amino acid efflux pump
MTILSFAAMVATEGADSPVQFVTGVFLGSMLWWTFLSAGASRLSSYLNAGSPLLQKGAAITLACFGAWALVKQVY